MERLYVIRDVANEKSMLASGMAILLTFQKVMLESHVFS